MYCFASACLLDAGELIDKLLSDHENNALSSVFDSTSKWHFTFINSLFHKWLLSVQFLTRLDVLQP